MSRPMTKTRITPLDSGFKSDALSRAKNSSQSNESIKRVHFHTHTTIKQSDHRLSFHLQLIKYLDI